MFTRKAKNIDEEIESLEKSIEEKLTKNDCSDGKHCKRLEEINENELLSYYVRVGE